MSAHTPRRVLIAWELGGNLGHVVPLLAVARALRERGVHLSQTPLRMSVLLPQCDALVCHGGNLSCAALLAGKPLLMYPVYVEQHLTAARAAGAGFAAVASGKTAVRTLMDHLESLLPGGTLNRAAVRLGERQDTSLRAPIDALVQRIESSGERETA